MKALLSYNLNLSLLCHYHGFTIRGYDWFMTASDVQTGKHKQFCLWSTGGQIITITNKFSHHQLLGNKFLEAVTPKNSCKHQSTSSPFAYDRPTQPISSCWKVGYSLRQSYTASVQLPNTCRRLSCTNHDSRLFLAKNCIPTDLKACFGGRWRLGVFSWRN